MNRGERKGKIQVKREREMRESRGSVFIVRKDQKRMKFQRKKERGERKKERERISGFSPFSPETEALKHRVWQPFYFNTFYISLFFF